MDYHGKSEEDTYMNKAHRIMNALRPRRSPVIPLVLLLMLALPAAAGGMVTSAGAAPAAAPRNERVIRVLVATPHTRICTNTDEPVRVRVETDVAGELDGEPVLLPGSAVNGIQVDGSVGDPSIGTLIPGSLTTGSLILNGPAAGFFKPGETAFTFHATEPGRTQLKFSAHLGPSNAGAGRDTLQAPPVDIEVVDCDYLVTMRFQWRHSGDFSAWAMGILDVQLKSDGQQQPGAGGLLQQYTGTGPFLFLNDVDVPGCATSLTGYTSETKIKGYLYNSGELQLVFEYQPAQQTAYASCEGGSASRSGEFDPTRSGIDHVKFPAEGGSKTFLTAGSITPGKLTITVTRVMPGGN
jgi:hypothetical protein